MSFWNTSDGEAVKAGGEYEAPGGLEPIPDKTDVIAYIDEIKWQEGKPEYGGGRKINYRITVMQPEAYKNRKVYLNLWPNGDNPAKDAEKAKKQGDKDKRMLGAIATNAGGGLLAVEGEPTDDDLARELTQKPMVFKLGLWSMPGDNGQTREGNYLMAVSPASKGVAEVKAQAPKTSSLDSDEIPF